MEGFSDFPDDRNSWHLDTDDRHLVCWIMVMGAGRQSSRCRDDGLGFDGERPCGLVGAVRCHIFVVVKYASSAIVEVQENRSVARARQSFEVATNLEQWHRSVHTHFQTNSRGEINGQV